MTSCCFHLVMEVWLSGVVRQQDSSGCLDVKPFGSTGRNMDDGRLTFGSSISVGVKGEVRGHLGREPGEEDSGGVRDEEEDIRGEERRNGDGGG